MVLQEAMILTMALQEAMILMTVLQEVMAIQVKILIMTLMTTQLRRVLHRVRRTWQDNFWEQFKA
jgi:ribulose-5-phosphate 4-epimerase/fuculose-1-phosphate aldolase